MLLALAQALKTSSDEYNLMLDILIGINYAIY